MRKQNREMKYLTLRRQDEEDVCLRLGEAPGGRAPLQGLELERRADGARGLCEDLRDLRHGACAGGGGSACGRAQRGGGDGRGARGRTRRAGGEPRAGAGGVV